MSTEQITSGLANLSTSPASELPKQPQPNQLTAQNLSQQNKEFLDHSQSPEMADTADQGLHLPAGIERSESYAGRTLAQKKRKYSADLYEFHKGTWQAVRDTVDQQKIQGGSSRSASTDTQTSK